VKYIIFSDIHLHTYSGEVDKESRLSKRLLIQKNILQQIIDLALQEDAIILFGGDMVHAVGNVPVEVINIIHWFFEEIKKCGIKFYAVEGNHDQLIRKNCSTWHSVLSPFQNREERDKELLNSKPAIRLVDYDKLEDVEQIKGFDIVIVHAQPDLINKHKHHMEGVNWKKVAKNNRYVFFGHDHTTRKLGAMAYVIGAPLQLTMNDVGEDRGCWIVDSETWDVQFHKLDYPELKRLEKIEGKEEVKFEERIKATSFQDNLVEWLDREQKPQSYLDLIKKDIEDKLQVVKNVFNGKATKIYLKDFLSIDEITVELKNGFWLVMGENGTGKTSFFEGIYWILFDCLSKDVAKQEVVKNRPSQQKEAIGELCLVDDKQFYTIRRSSKNGIEVLTDNVNLVDGMTKTQAQEFLEKNILGFDKNTYLAACYFSQEQLLTLAQLGSADTTNIVTNLLGFETYDSLYVQMDLKKKEVTLQIELLEQSSVKLNNDIWKNNEQQKSIKEQINSLKVMELSLKDEQLKINQQIDEFTILLGNTVVPSVTTEEIDVSLLSLNSAKSEMSTKQRTLQEDGQNRTHDLRNQLSILQKDLTTIIQKQNKIDKEKTAIEITKRLTLENISKHEAIVASLKENKCSYCGTILNKEDLEKHLAEEQAEIYVLVNKTMPKDNLELDKQLEKLYDQEAQSQELIENINKQVIESDAEIKSLIALNFAEITKIECDIQELQVKKGQAIKEITEANGRKDSLTQQIKQLEQRKLTIVNQIQQVNIDDKLTQLKELEIELLALNFCLTGNKEKILAFNENKTIYDFWSVAFSNKGIRPLLLDKFVNSFNETVKHFCYEVSNGEFIVQFSPTSTTRAGLERNKLGLEVVYKDKIVSYASLSGGEKTRIALPLCFGLNKWISKMYNVSNGLLGIVVLDEMFCYTDVKFRESVAQLLYEEGKMRSVFVIDHSDTLACYTNQLWNITKENDTTQLQIT
jgi:DNA repair exonuclease SbcCD ATPase subunit/DNA repair exonuclease SbcCD nuclease subunit